MENIIGKYNQYGKKETYEKLNNLMGWLPERTAQMGLGIWL